MKTPKTKTTKPQSITTGINKVADYQIANMLEHMTVKKLNETARQNGVKPTRIKWDTCVALALHVNAPGRNCTVTVTINFI